METQEHMIIRSQACEVMTMYVSSRVMKTFVASILTFGAQDASLIYLLHTARVVLSDRYLPSNSSQCQTQ